MTDGSTSDQVLLVSMMPLALFCIAQWARCIPGLWALNGTPFTKILFGQFALLATLEALGWIGSILAHWHLPTVPIVLVAWLPLLLAVRPWMLRGKQVPPIGDWAHLVPGVVMLTIVGWWVAQHQAALGLDQHTHLSLINHILSNSYGILTHEFTNIINPYPKVFHLLISGWCAAGLGLLPATHLKMAPILQGFLICAAFSEVVALWIHAERRTIARIGFIAALALFATLATPMVYPVYDQLGTPRFSSSAFLFAPLLLFLLSNATRQAHWSWMAVSFGAPWLAWNLGVNPTILVLALLFTPCFLVIGAMGGIWRPAKPSLRLSLACLLVALCSMSRNGLVVDRIVSSSRGLASATGVTTGRLIDQEQPPTPEPAQAPASPKTPPNRPLHLGGLPGQFVDQISGNVQRSFGWLDSIRTIPPSTVAELDKRLLKASAYLWPQRRPYVSIILMGVCVAAWTTLLFLFVKRRRQGKAPLEAGGRYRLLLAWWIICPWILAGLIDTATALLSASLAESHLSNLLVQYLHDGTYYFSPTATWISVLLPVAVALSLLAPAGSSHPKGSSRNYAVLTAAVVIVAFGVDAARDLDPTIIKHRGFYSPVSSTDIKAWRRLLLNVAEAEAIIVPARIHELGKESWLIPEGEVLSALPYSTRRLVFDLTNRFSARISVHDLEIWCKGDGLSRADLVDRLGVKWLALSHREVQSKEFYDAARFCSRSLPYLGFAYPPQHVEGRYALFKIDRKRLLQDGKNTLFELAKETPSSTLRVEAHKIALYAGFAATFRTILFAKNKCLTLALGWHGAPAPGNATVEFVTQALTAEEKPLLPPVAVRLAPGQSPFAVQIRLPDETPTRLRMTLATIGEGRQDWVDLAEPIIGECAPAPALENPR